MLHIFLNSGDVDGSVEAILDALNTYESDQCRLNLINYGVGQVTEQDVQMASNFNGKYKYLINHITLEQVEVSFAYPSYPSNQNKHLFPKNRQTRAVVRLHRKLEVQ